MDTSIISREFQLKSKNFSLVFEDKSIDFKFWGIDCVDPLRLKRSKLSYELTFMEFNKL